jgi:hypothetical protein
MISGVVTDSLTHEKLAYISVYYDGKGVGTITDNAGYFQVEARSGWTTLTISSMGYRKKTVQITPGVTKKLQVKLVPDDIVLGEVVIKAKKERYRRKNNPAVEMMKRVLAAKQVHSLDEHDFYRFDQYDKVTLSIADATPEKLQRGLYKKLPFLSEQVEMDPDTKQLILPISVQETASEVLYRKDPKMKKTFVKGIKSTGLDNLFDVGNGVTEITKEVFSDVNIYENNLYMLKKQFVSPISDNAISFYKYFIMDTVYVEKDKCFHLSFVPQNSQDFGFTGHLYVLADSSYIVRKCTMQLPKHNGVNFVENLKITQEFGQLANGEWTLLVNDMSTDIYPPVLKLEKGQVRRITRYSHHDFNPIAEADFGNSRTRQTAADAMLKNEAFWAAKRDIPLTGKEINMQKFVKQVETAPNLQATIWVLRFLVENYVGTGRDSIPSKIDLGPLSTIVSTNYVDGVRFRFGGVTTAHLNPHLFWNGYYAYGVKDGRSKYKTELEYSFEKKTAHAKEFPRNAIKIGIQSEVESPTDKYLSMDKDNMFGSVRTSTVDMMLYTKKLSLQYEYEAFSGFSTKLKLEKITENPTGKLVYQRNSLAEEPDYVNTLKRSEVGVTFRYAPGEEYVNTKQGRFAINRNAPVFTVAHTMGIKGLWGADYRSNLTEISVFKRVWLSSWGRLDVNLNLGAQWEKVPFPLLTTAPANLSYFLQTGMFNLMNNLEFLSDRYAILDLDYDMNGKFLNRIPLLRRLKWREHFGVKAMCGTLTNRNNPYLHPGDADLYLFPMKDGMQRSYALDSDKPYVEVSVGVHNIFKLLQVEYVRRLSYLEHPDINKRGLRLGVKFSF